MIFVEPVSRHEGHCRYTREGETDGITIIELEIFVIPLS